MPHQRLVGSISAGPWLVPTAEHPVRAAFLVRFRRGAGGATRRVIAVGNLAEACIAHLATGLRVTVHGRPHTRQGRPRLVELIARRITIQLDVTT